MQSGVSSIVQSQIQQAVVRTLFGTAVVLYLYLLAPEFERYQTYLLPLAALYILSSLASIPAIRQRPVSTARTLIYPFIDIAITSFAMTIDGGHTSGLYFLFLMIIFGNGLRWGNALLVYCQALSILGLVAVSIFTLTQMEYNLDHSLLVWQIAALIIIPLYVYLVGDDTERAAQEKQHSDETSFMLLDQGPVPVFTFDLDDSEMPRIHYANAAINQVFHEDLTFLIGERPDILTILEDGHDMLEFCRRTMLTVSKEPQVVHVRGRDKKGGILQLMCCGRRLRWRNRWLGTCYVIDMTRIETLRDELQEEQSQEYVSTLISGIVHDFRNVLTKMMGLAEIAQVETDDATMQQRLEEIINAGEQGSALSRDMARLGKKAPKLVADAKGERVSRQMIENSIGLIRMRLKPDIQLHCNVDEHLPLTTAKPAEIELLLLSLIQNSIQSIRKSGLIEVSVWRDDNDALASSGNPSLGIRVADNGSGIADENLELIFDPFWTTHAEEGHSGLGLVMVKHTVDSNRGRIDIHSSPQGTSMIIHIPGFTPSPAASVSTPRLPAKTITEEKVVCGKVDDSARIDDGSCRILLVDDAPEVLSIHEALLRRLKLNVDTASNGQQALEMFEAQSPAYDLVITDFRMPRMNGLELATAIRGKQPEARIMIITAYGEETQLQKAAAQGIRLLNKPVTLVRLEQVVREVLSK